MPPRGDPAKLYMHKLAWDDFIGGLTAEERRIWMCFWRHQDDDDFVQEMWRELGDLSRDEIETELRGLYERWSRVRREYGR